MTKPSTTTNASAETKTISCSCGFTHPGGERAVIDSITWWGCPDCGIDLFGTLEG